jgi:glycosyltransferase involved in cell wall biosynthesis
VKVVVASPYYPPHIGGAERYCREICAGLVRRHGWRIVVATSSVGAQEGVSEEDGVIVHRMPVRAMVSATPVNPAWYRWLSSLIRAEAPDAVIGHSPGPFMADVAAVAGRAKPFVLTYHSGPLAKGQPVFDIVAGAYEKLVLPTLIRHASAVIHYSPDFSRMYPRLLLGKEHVVTPGVDLARFSPNGSEPAVPNVLYVGRLERSSRWKGVRHLLDAVPSVLRSVPDLQVDLVGDGDDALPLAEYASSKGLEGVVNFRGALAGAGLVERYRSASVVVLPSTTASESFGMTLLEAAACGRPVVASRIGGVPTVVSDGVTGLLVSPGDPSALADGIVKVLGDGNLARSLGQAGAKRASREFSWDSRVDATREILQRVTR